MDSKDAQKPTKQRYIAASNKCSTKPLSAVLTKCLRHVERQHKIIGKRYEIQHSINPFWIISNSTQVFQRMAKMNHEKECTHIRTYDFSNMYTSIPH